MSLGVIEAIKRVAQINPQLNIITCQYTERLWEKLSSFEILGDNEPEIKSTTAIACSTLTSKSGDSKIHFTA
jgi:hypothetical protein